MSCCAVPSEKKIDIPFDEVVIEEYKKYDRLVIKDKPPHKGGFDCVWFDLKIRKMINTRYPWRHYSDKEKPVVKALKSLSVVAKDIKEWSKPRQASLFGDEKRSIRIDEVYEKIEKYIYDPIDYRMFLPESDSLKNFLKKHLSNIMRNYDEIKCLDYRDKQVWYPRFHILLDGSPKSDLDILDWLYMVRMYITDKKGKNIFWIEGEEVTPCIDLDPNYAILPSYKGLIFDKEMIDYVRNLFGLEYAPIRSDKEAIEKAVEKYMEFVSRYLPKDWKEYADNKKLKKAIASINTYCGVLSGLGFDGYGYHIEMPAQKLEVTQAKHCRRFANPNNPENWTEGHCYTIESYKEDEIINLVF